MRFVCSFCVYMLYTFFTYNHPISSLPMLFLITSHYHSTFRLTFLVCVYRRECGASFGVCLYYFTLFLFRWQIYFFMIDKTPFYIQTTFLFFTCCCARSLVPYLCYHDYFHKEHRHRCLFDMLSSFPLGIHPGFIQKWILWQFYF